MQREKMEGGLNASALHPQIFGAILFAQKDSTEPGHQNCAALAADIHEKTQPKPAPDLPWLPRNSPPISPPTLDLIYRPALA